MPRRDRRSRPVLRSWRGCALLAAALLAGAGSPAAQERGAQEPTTPGPAPAAAGELPFVELDNGLRLATVDVAASRAVAIAAVVGVGSDHDPAGAAGMARVQVALLRFAQEQDGVAETDGFQVFAIGRATVLATLVEAGAVPARLAFLERLLGVELETDDDLLRRARARARLDADTDLHILPGPILLYRARAALLAGEPGARPACGLPDEIGALEPARITARLRRLYRPERTRVAVIGDLAGAGGDAALRARLGAVPAGDAADPPAVAVPAGEPSPAHTEHARVDGPFVSAALAAPVWGDDDFVPFLVAMAVVSARAHATFREHRGGEVRARFPFVDHGYWQGAEVVLVNRRGEDGGDAGGPRREIAALLGRLRAEGAGLREIGAAAASVASTVALPPYDEGMRAAMARAPSLLANRAMTLVIADVLGWPADLADLIGRTTAGQVQAVLRERLDAERLAWFSLVPAAKPPSQGGDGRR